MQTSEQHFDARLRKLIELLGFRSGNEFASHMGFSSAEKVNRLLRSPKNKPSMEFLEAIAHKFAIVNMRWLITGEGSWKNMAPIQSNKYTSDSEEMAPNLAPNEAPNEEMILNEPGARFNSSEVQTPFKRYSNDQEDQDTMKAILTLLVGMQGQMHTLSEDVAKLKAKDESQDNG